MARAYVSCFNVDPQFVSGFNVPKNIGGEYKIKFMDAAFNKEACSGEFFIEFEEQLWYSKLLEAFEIHGAGDVYIATFKHNDGNDSAANALLRVWELAEKTGLSSTRGKCSDALITKTMAKQAEAKNKKKESEFDEKTQAAIKASMQNMEGDISHVKVKVDHVGDQISSIETGVCKTILDYQKENERLKAALAQKTLDCDRQEKKVADMTRVKNQNEDLRNENMELHQEVSRLKRELKLHEALEAANEAMETAKLIMTEARALKRARRDTEDACTNSDE